MLRASEGVGVAFKYPAEALRQGLAGLSSTEGESKVRHSGFLWCSQVSQWMGNGKVLPQRGGKRGNEGGRREKEG